MDIRRCLTPTRCISESAHLLSQSAHDSNDLSYSLKRPQPVTRRPFHYPIGNSGSHEHVGDPSHAATYNRYRYYSRLADPEIDTLSIPDHVVPEHFFHPFLYTTLYSAVGKQSSIVTVFAMWNTMMGTSLLSMPWALSQAGLAGGIALMILMGFLGLMAGLAGGIALMIVMGFLCAYTAYRIICLPKILGLTGIVEFSDICTQLLGGWAKWVSLFFSILPLVGGAIVYWVLMTNFLYNSVLFVYETLHGDYANSTLTNSSLDVQCSLPVPFNSTASTGLFHKIWDLNGSVPLFLVICLGPIVCLKSPTFFAKFNALGTLSVLYLFVFMGMKVSSWGFHVDVQFPDSPEFVSLFSPNFPALTGILSLAYFIHNGILTLMRNQKYPENNARDLVVAFGLVMLTYLVIGTFFYLCFPLPKDCIQDNILNNFKQSDVFAVVTRAILLFQLFTLFPLVVYWCRLQFMHAVFHNVYPGAIHVVILNAVLLATCIIFAIYLPHIGTIIRYCGALSGLVYVFTLPSVTYMKALHHLSPGTATAHLLIIVVGVANFVAQFLL